MTKKSILKGFAPKVKNGVQETYNGQNGVLYKYIASFENGDAGEANSTSQAPKWKIGAEYTYDLSSREYNGNTYYSIKSLKQVEVASHSNGGGSSYVAKSAAEWKSHAMQVSIESTAWYFMNSNISPEHRIACIDKIYKWITGVVMGNDKMYWRAFSIIKSAINFYLSPATDMKNLNDVLLYANTLYAMCDIEEEQKEDVLLKEAPAPQSTQTTPSVSPTIQQEPIQQPVDPIYPKDDDEELPF